MLVVPGPGGGSPDGINSNVIALPLQSFLKNPLFSVAVRNSTVTGSTAGAVGGGIAFRASNLVESPGARSVDLVDVTITNCAALRGGGTFAWVWNM